MLPQNGKRKEEIIMLKFDAERMEREARANLADKDQLIALADQIHAEGYTNLFFIGVGGTITYAMIMDANLRAYTALPYYAEHAADFNTQGNRRFSDRSVVIVSSASGDTPEILEAVTKARQAGARVVAFVETPGTPIAENATYSIAGASHYRFYTFLFRLAYDRGEFPQFNGMIENLEKLPALLPKVSEQADEKCAAYAKAHRDDAIQYLVGSGNLWGATYSYGMCIMEEMQWMRTKSISAGDLFHGTLEVIDRDTNVLLFVGEDATRPQMERAERFLRRVCRNVTVFDTADYALSGLDPAYRGLFAPFILGAVTSRISVHLEEEGKHPLEIRRYYRKLTY